MTDSNSVETSVMSYLTSTTFLRNAGQSSVVKIQLLPNLSEIDYWFVNNCLNCLAPDLAATNGPS